MQALPGPVKCLRAPLGHISFLLALTHLRLQFLLLLEAPSSMAASPSAKVYSENPVGSKLNASVLRGKATPFWTGCWEDQRSVTERRVRRAESQEKKMGVHSWKRTHKHDDIYICSIAQTYWLSFTTKRNMCKDVLTSLCSQIPYVSVSCLDILQHYTGPLLT